MLASFCLSTILNPNIVEIARTDRCMLVLVLLWRRRHQDLIFDMSTDSRLTCNATGHSLVLKFNRLADYTYAYKESATFIPKTFHTRTHVLGTLILATLNIKGI